MPGTRGGSASASTAGNTSILIDPGAMAPRGKSSDLCGPAADPSAPATATRRAPAASPPRALARSSRGRRPLCVRIPACPRAQAGSVLDTLRWRAGCGSRSRRCSRPGWTTRRAPARRGRRARPLARRPAVACTRRRRPGRALSSLTSASEHMGRTSTRAIGGAADGPVAAVCGGGFYGHARSGRCPDSKCGCLARRHICDSRTRSKVWVG